MEPLDLIIGLLIGLIIGPLVLYVVLKRTSFSKSQSKSKGTNSLHLSIQSKIIQMPELEKAKKDLKTLLLEKELLSSAITRVFEAEAQNKISKEERDILCKKYREQLRSVEEKLGNIESLIEVGELENLHDELVGLFERKIKQLEDRLQQAKTKVDLTRGIQISPKPQSKLEQKTQKPKVVSEETKVDQKVKELRDEVLDALTKLEQIDMEK